jgi:hypothetical protein
VSVHAPLERVLVQERNHGLDAFEVRAKEQRKAHWSWFSQRHVQGRRSGLTTRPEPPLDLVKTVDARAISPFEGKGLACARL